VRRKISADVDGGLSGVPAVRTRERGPPSASAEIYNCDIGQCQVGCVCSICNSPISCTRRSCADTPSENCDNQCCEHKIGIARLFACLL
jgi:hypothetical protein